MFGMKYIDDEGQDNSRHTRAGSGEPPEGWYLSKIAQAESLRRSMVAVNNIEPVTVARFNERIAIEERHFNPIVGQSHFVLGCRHPCYALGFARFFQGDFASAAHLLIPHWRRASATSSKPVSRSDQAAGRRHGRKTGAWTQSSLTTAPASGYFWEHLCWRSWIGFFNIKPGPHFATTLHTVNYRPELGYSADVIYACWLLYRVCCLFLMERWEDWVRPIWRLRSLGADSFVPSCQRDPAHRNTRTMAGPRWVPPRTLS